jgi:hypothetical protein
MVFRCGVKARQLKKDGETGKKSLSFLNLKREGD